MSLQPIHSYTLLFKHQQTEQIRKQEISGQIMQDEPTLHPSKSKQNPKSSLNPINGQSSRNIQYLSKNNLEDKPMDISDQEKQQEINRMREEYVQEKLNRKKQMIKIKKQEFGSSSSEDDDVGVEGSLSGRSEEISPKSEDKPRKNSESISKQQDQTHPLSKPQKIYQLTGKQTWNETSLILKEKKIVLKDKEYELGKVHKIKSIPVLVGKNLLKVKISHNSDDVMVGVPKQMVGFKKERLSLHYIVFASMISRKLQLMGLKFCPLQKTVPGVPESIIKNSCIYGKIFKKSQILGRWQERLIVINEMGLYSYKRFNEQHSMFIAAKSVKEVWTRFQIVDQNLLVIKILHSSNTKTEFGIPITDFMNQKNWLFQIYHMAITSLHPN